MFQLHHSPSCELRAVLFCRSDCENNQSRLCRTTCATSAGPALSVFVSVCEVSTLLEPPENIRSTRADMALNGCLLAIGTLGGKIHLYTLYAVVESESDSDPHSTSKQARVVIDTETWQFSLMLCNSCNITKILCLRSLWLKLRPHLEDCAVVHCVTHLQDETKSED